MKEYAILIKQGTGNSYILGTYPDISSAKRAIINLANYEEEKNKMYFVDNDFFDNKYSYIGNGLKYMCIKEREVTDWIKYNECNDDKKFSNIFYLKNY